MSKYEFMVANGDKAAPPTIKELWQGLNETTTAHGLPRAYQYKGKSHSDTDLFYLPVFPKKYISHIIACSFFLFHLDS